MVKFQKFHRQYQDSNLILTVSLIKQQTFVQIISVISHYELRLPSIDAHLWTIFVKFVPTLFSTILFINNRSTLLEYMVRSK